MSQKLDDNSPMPFGRYSGQKMINVPGKYLLYVKDTFTRNQTTKDVLDYIEDNLDVLQKEVKECSQ